MGNNALHLACDALSIFEAPAQSYWRDGSGIPVLRVRRNRRPRVTVLVFAHAAAEADGGNALSVHRSVADFYDMAPACLSRLVFSVTTHSALALEAVLPPKAAEPSSPLQFC